MIAGMLPMALGFGEGAADRAAGPGRDRRPGCGDLCHADCAASVYTLLQRRAGAVSPSLDPDDPQGRFYERTGGSRVSDSIDAETRGTRGRGWGTEPTRRRGDTGTRRMQAWTGRWGERQNRRGDAATRGRGDETRGEDRLPPFASASPTTHDRLTCIAQRCTCAPRPTTLDPHRGAMPGPPPTTLDPHRGAMRRSPAPGPWPQSCLAAVLLTTAALAQPVEVTKVIARNVERTVQLPGEFLPYESVAIHAKVTGFVDRVEVDRGSFVRNGQLLATLVAPELKAQTAEAEAKVQAAESNRAEAEARVVAAQSTYDRLKNASATRGPSRATNSFRRKRRWSCTRPGARGGSIRQCLAGIRRCREGHGELPQCQRPVFGSDHGAKRSSGRPGGSGGQRERGADVPLGTEQQAPAGGVGSGDRGVRNLARDTGVIYGSGTPGRNLHRCGGAYSPLDGSQDAFDGRRVGCGQCTRRARAGHVRHHHMAGQQKARFAAGAARPAWSRPPKRHLLFVSATGSPNGLRSGGCPGLHREN